MVEAYSILVVDDNLLNLKLIEKVLTKEGYIALSADNGSDARRIAAQEYPDLILLDIEMPGEDGFEVIKKLKNDAATVTIPVLFLTGVSEVGVKLKGFELGGVDYIVKPFHPLEVLARVRIHLKLSIATNCLVRDQARKLRQVTQAQNAMLPRPENFPDAGFSVFYLPLEEAGGDFYDVLNRAVSLIVVPMMLFRPRLFSIRCQYIASLPNVWLKAQKGTLTFLRNNAFSTSAENAIW